MGRYLPFFVNKKSIEQNIVEMIFDKRKRDNQFDKNHGGGFYEGGVSL